VTLHCIDDVGWGSGAVSITLS